MAKQGIGKTLDFFSRDEETRSDFYIVIAREAKAEDVLDVLTSPEKIPANHLFNSLKNSAKSWAATTDITLDELTSAILIFSDSVKQFIARHQKHGN